MKAKIVTFISDINKETDSVIFQQGGYVYFANPNELCIYDKDGRFISIAAAELKDGDTFEIEESILLNQCPFFIKKTDLKRISRKLGFMKGL